MSWLFSILSHIPPIENWSKVLLLWPHGPQTVKGSVLDVERLDEECVSPPDIDMGNRGIVATYIGGAIIVCRGHVKSCYIVIPQHF